MIATLALDAEAFKEVMSVVVGDEGARWTRRREGDEVGVALGWGEGKGEGVGLGFGR